MEEDHSLKPITDTVVGAIISLLTIVIPSITITLQPIPKMESIEKHIKTDEQILSDPMISKQQRRHIESELQDLKLYQEHNPEDHHDPTPIELYCDSNPSADECKIYDD